MHVSNSFCFARTPRFVYVHSLSVMAFVKPVIWSNCKCLIPRLYFLPPPWTIQAGLGMDVEGRVQSTAERKPSVLKGSCAQFLRQNPRFLNEPLCHLLPNETSRSVADCMEWTQEDVPTAVQNV